MLNLTKEEITLLCEILTTLLIRYFQKFAIYKSSRKTLFQATYIK